MLHITTTVAILCLLWTSNGLYPGQVRDNERFVNYNLKSFRPKPRGYFYNSNSNAYSNSNSNFNSNPGSNTFDSGYYDSSLNYYNYDYGSGYDYSAYDSSFDSGYNYYNYDSSYDSSYYYPQQRRYNVRQERMSMPMLRMKQKPRMVPVQMQQRMVKKPRVVSYTSTNTDSQCIQTECSTELQYCSLNADCNNAIQKTVQNQCGTEIDCTNPVIMCDTGSVECVTAWNNLVTCYMNNCDNNININNNNGQSCVEQNCNNYGDVDACKANSICNTAFQSASNGNCGDQCDNANYMCNGDSNCIQIFQNLIYCYNALCDTSNSNQNSNSNMQRLKRQRQRERRF